MVNKSRSDDKSIDVYCLCGTPASSPQLNDFSIFDRDTSARSEGRPEPFTTRAAAKEQVVAHLLSPPRKNVFSKDE